MSLNIKVASGTYPFDGPYESATDLPAASGVYVISTKQQNGKHRVLDVGESGDVRERVSNHDRASCWDSHKRDSLYMSAYQCGETTRMSLEGEIRKEYEPPCGEK